MKLPAGVITAGKGGIYLQLHAQPGAKRAALKGLHGDALKLAVKEAPEGGKANKAIEVFVAGALKLPKSAVAVTSGQTSRSKRLFIEGDAMELERRIADWLAASG